MQRPNYTKSQKLIINHLYKFRYLSIHLLQQLFNHKDPKRIKEWLKDLHNNKYIEVIKDPKDVTKAYVFCLAQGSRNILKTEEGINLKFLNRLYKEKDTSENFINRHLFVAEAYLYFLKNKEKKSEINFFTKQDLTEYTYFPDPLPDAYIDVEEETGNSRYFLDYFDDNTPPGVTRYRVKNYFKYFQNGAWQANTENSPFPSILLVFSNKARKVHIDFYSKALLAKSFNNDIEIFLTTKEKVKSAESNTNIWEKVKRET